MFQNQLKIAETLQNVIRPFLQPFQEETHCFDTDKNRITTIQVLVPARAWRFESSFRHSEINELSEHFISLPFSTVTCRPLVARTF